MNDIQEIIYRVRKGQSVEAIHRDTGHAKKTIRKYRNLADKHGFLEKNGGLPASSELAAVLGPVRQCKVRSVALAFAVTEFVTSVSHFPQFVLYS